MYNYSFSILLLLFCSIPTMYYSPYQVDDYEERVMQELEKQLYEEGQDDEDDTQVYAPAPAADMEVSPATPPQASPMEVCHPIPAKVPAPVSSSHVVPPPQPKGPAIAASPMDVCPPSPAKAPAPVPPAPVSAPRLFPRHSRKVPLSQLRRWMFALRVPPKPRHLCLPWR